MKKLYTQKEDETLTKMWKNEEKLEKISTVLNRSKKSIMNRRTLLGLPGRGAAKNKIKNIPIPKPPEPEIGTVLLIDIKSNQCHYPCDGQLYCGEMNTVKPYGYCRRHHRKVYRPAGNVSPGH